MRGSGARGRAARWCGVGLALLGGCDGGEETDPPEPDRVDAILALTGDAANGQSIWDNLCESCHSGQEAVFGGLSPESQANAVLTGPGAMPDFSGYSDQEIADILAFLASAG
ncbi:MAG: cytochrome c [Myxococcota bacterium]